MIWDWEIDPCSTTVLFGMYHLVMNKQEGDPHAQSRLGAYVDAWDLWNVYTIIVLEPGNAVCLIGRWGKGINRAM